MNNPILIGGCGSSGTTLLRKMLNSHKNIICGPEMSVFDRPMIYSESIDYLYTLWRTQDFDPLDKGCIFPLRIQNRYTADLSYCGLVHENHMKFYYQEPDQVEKIFDESESILEFLDLFFSGYAEKRKVERWCEKTPNNIFCADEWLRAYPDGKYINVLRDGRDTILSMNWRRKVPIYIGTYRWIAAVNKYMGIRCEKDLCERILNVRYESLVENTEFELEMICYFLNEEFDPDMLDYWKEDTEEPKTDLKYGTQPVFTDSIGKWQKDDYDRTILDQILMAIQPQLESMGYEIE
jgi:hypothetical protein